MNNISPSWPRMPQLPVSWGEVFDKLTILQIKEAKLADSPKLANVRAERTEIERVVGDTHKYPSEVQALVDRLRAINLALWDVEDAKRDCERRQCFDDVFIQLARRVYIENDRRAAIKKEVNQWMGSTIVEEKSYQKY